MRWNRLWAIVFFMEAWLLLHCSRFVIAFVPFKRIMRFLEERATLKTRLAPDANTLFMVRLSIHRAARLSMHHSKCYDKALTAKLMLKKRNISSIVYFGVAKEPDTGLTAHAWVTVGDIIVVGREGVDRFTPLMGI